MVLSSADCIGQLGSPRSMYNITPKVLGKGSFAEVKMGYDETNNETVAIKIIPREKVEKNPTAIQTEINILSRIQHGNIVHLHDAFSSPDGDVYLVLEHIVGPTLLHFLRKKRVLAEPEARHLFSQILEAFYYLHYNDVVHCDVKLDNILLEPSLNSSGMHATIIDFGFAKILPAECRKLTDPCGSLLMSAPEVVQHKPYDHKADIWSLGAILYAMIYGTYPFLASNKSEVTRKILTGEVHLSEYNMLGRHVSIRVRHLIRWMLTVNPDKRPDITEILMHPWFEPDSIPIPNDSPIPNTLHLI